VGAENSVTSCILHVLVYEAAETVSAQWSNGRAGASGSATHGRVLMQRSVWPMGVVVHGVLAQHNCEVALSGDQQVIEAFAAQCAFDHRVRLWCANWGAEDADVGASEDCVEGGGELAVPVTDRIKNWNRSARSPRSMRRVASLLGDPGVPETPHTSRGLLILVEQSTELVAPLDGVRLASRSLGEWL
jgi:hypothetical protein